MSDFRIRRTVGDIIVPADSTAGTQVALTDEQVNGILRGVIITVPSMTDTESISNSESITVTESKTVTVV